jgi:hypothetical protein
MQRAAGASAARQPPSHRAAVQLTKAPARHFDRPLPCLLGRRPIFRMGEPPIGLPRSTVRAIVGMQRRPPEPGAQDKRTKSFRPSLQTIRNRTAPSWALSPARAGPARSVGVRARSRRTPYPRRADDVRGQRDRGAASRSRPTPSCSTAASAVADSRGVSVRSCACPGCSGDQGRRLCRSDSQRREAGELAGAATDQISVRDQSADHEGAGRQNL